MLTEDELSEIEQRCQAAPEGPWMVTLNENFSFHVRKHAETAPRISPKFYPEEVVRRLAEFDVTDENGFVVHNPQVQCAVADGVLHQLNFIAHARADVPRLLAEIKALRKNQVLSGR